MVILVGGLVKVANIYNDVYFSTIDNIFILRQIYEKCHECNIELHNVFIDFNQAFDSIHRSTVTKVLKEMQIPGKIIRLITLVTQRTKAKIKLNSEYTEQLEVKIGIRQGDPLSINNIVLHRDGVIDEKIRDEREYINATEASLCLCGRYCAGDKN